jgi:D,D-heptose 1,7-bisphosphate phosphatase
MLHGSLNCRVIWAATAGETVPREVKEYYPEGYFVELLDYPIEKLAAILARSRLTISNDSGLMHLSSAVGTPVVALFGPTHQSLGFAPRGLFDRVVEVDEFCRPCSIHGKGACHREQRYCFTRISPEMVYQVARETWESVSKAGKALFVDRDGTIIVDKHFLADPEQVELIDGSAEALKAAREAGFRIVIISNQSGVARGRITIEEVERVNARLLGLLTAAGVEIDGLYYCPYYREGTVPEYAVESELRKPAPGMPEAASRELGIDLRCSVVIGDKLDDLNLGRVIGSRSFLVRTGHGSAEEEKLRGQSLFSGKTVFENLRDAVDYMIG